MRIFLSGPMGTGKSTVAKEIAQARGVMALDLDALIEQAEGKRVTEIFAERGERAFRDLEAKHVRQLIARHADCVVALGGGTVTQQATRRALLDHGVVVTLRAAPEQLARRLQGATDRPLLAQGDPVATLRALMEERRAAYAECHGSVDASAEPSAVARDVLALVARDPIVVALGERSYPVLIGRGNVDTLAARMSDTGRSPSSILLVTDRVVGPLHAATIEAQLRTLGAPIARVELEPGESAKHIGSVQRIWDTALRHGVDRDALVLGVGGGVVGDLAGFAAATILRGIGLAHVPTTMLAMVDSAIGGKTGFDTEQGKNLIGAFHQPRFVLSDIDLLGTLPIEERRAGLAEVVKSAWLDNEASVAELERDAALLHAGDPTATQRAVRMAAALKARVVSGDEREGGARALLNLGHTVGHAIEASLGYQGMRHGEAVALGMIAAFRLARSLGRSGDHLERMTRLLQTLGLPTDVDRYLTPQALAFMASDKKRGAGKLKFIVPSAPGETEVVALPLDDIERRVRK